MGEEKFVAQPEGFPALPILRAAGDALPYHCQFAIANNGLKSR
jgi:hypothetical protein